MRRHIQERPSLTRHDAVVINVLDIIAIVEHRHEFFEHRKVVFADLGIGLRNESDFLNLQFEFRESFLQCLRRLEEFTGRSEQSQLAILVFDVVDVDVRVQHGFKNFVFVVTFERKDRQMIEEVGDRPCRAKLRPRLREAVSNIGNCSVWIVG